MLSCWIFFFPNIVRCWFEVSDFMNHDYDSSSWRHHSSIEQRCQKNENWVSFNLESFFSKKSCTIVNEITIRRAPFIWCNFRSLRSQEIPYDVKKRLSPSENPHVFFSSFFDRFSLKTFKIVFHGDLFHF